MRQVLEFILTHAARQLGEAEREFVLAIAIGRLRLTKDDTDKLWESHGRTGLDPVFDSLLIQIRKDANSPLRSD